MARARPVRRSLIWELAERLPADECWEWPGRRTAKGYGRCGWERVHRLSYERFVGPLTPGLVVRHTCDNPPCFNWRHLIEGTHAENVEDRMERGKSWFKLSPEAVRAIFLSTRTRRQLALEHGVCIDTICGIWNRKTRRKITEGLVRPTTGAYVTHNG